jgi:pimeloyl-ACP methyl ester carboxylesterase
MAGKLQTGGIASAQAEPPFSRLAVGNGPEGRTLAVRARPGRGPTVVWLGGFRSDMASTKAVAIDNWAAASGQAMVRMDYTAHGESSGRFEDCTISVWLEDAIAVLQQAVSGPAVVVGSSMGGWIALLANRAFRHAGHPDKIAGMVLIAPAVDFTEALMWAQFPDTIRQQIMAEGVWRRPSAYDPTPYPITKALIEDGRRNLLFGAPFEVGCPVHILQGMQDPDVPWQHAMTLVEHLPRDPVQVSLINDGDHRLSRPQDIDLLVRAVAAMTKAAA